MPLVALASVAVTAQHLQVIRAVAAAFGYWLDMIYFKLRAILCRCAAHLAAVVITLEDLKPQARLDWLALYLRLGFWFLFWLWLNVNPFDITGSFVLNDCELWLGFAFFANKFDYH